MKISVLFPTRNRAQMALESALSLLGNMSTDNDLEILFAVDSDDTETIQALTNFPKSKMLVSKPRGYKNLHNYINDLCALSTGDWLFLWNDDASMKTFNWDKLIEPYIGQMVEIDFKTNHASNRYIFCIVPKKYYELVGHFSLCPNNDTWILEVFEPLGLRRNVDGFILHDRYDLTGNNNDENYQQQRKFMREFKSDEMVQARKKDLEIIKNYIENGSV